MKLVFISLTQSPRGGGPPRAGTASLANHDATRLSLKLDFISEFGFL
jgi:hypothetical protein